MIKVDSLSKSFGGTPVLDQVNFTVEQDEVVSLVGDNGAGKTTLFKLLLGYLEQDSGKVENLAKSFSNNRILKNVSFSIFGNEHVWLYGLNGTGKTTLFKIIIGDEQQERGTVELGMSVNIGYFSQEKQDLSLDNTVLDELNAVGFDRTQAYKQAVQFHLTPDDLTKKVEQLSTGQKAKVAFAKLVSRDYQLLLLDEPTNHLDIETREAIEESLTRYQGAILVISHDRYFLNTIGINRQLVLKDGAIK